MGSFQKGKRFSQSGMIPGSWQYEMKLHLILKSSRAYYILSDAAMSLQKYGRALRYIKLALHCHGKFLELTANPPTLFPTINMVERMKLDTTPSIDKVSAI